MQLPDNMYASYSAVVRLYERHALALFTFLRHKLQSREDAEDVLAQVFVALLESREIHQLNEKEQLAWLWQVARHKAVDAYRRSTVRQGMDLDMFTELIYDEEAQAPEQVSLRREEYAQLHRYLAQLPPVQREAVRLRFANDLRCSEIGAALGKSEGAVRVMISRALNALRQLYVREQERTK